MSREKQPTTLNVFIMLVASVISLFVLWYASHTESHLLAIVCATVFSFSNNTVFSLLHEAVHGLFAQKKRLNDLMGNIAAAFFPTGFTFQKTCHLGHHLRNRTDHEIFDLYYPNDNRVLKFVQFYCILLGPYWLSNPLGALIYLVYPRSFRIFRWIDGQSKGTDAAMLLPFIDNPRQGRIRAEILFSLVFQVCIFWWLDVIVNS